MTPEQGTPVNEPQESADDKPPFDTDEEDAAKAAAGDPDTIEGSMNPPETPETPAQEEKPRRKRKARD